MTADPLPAAAVERGQGRRLPQSLEAEAAVLGAMLLDSSAIGRAIEANLREDDFVKPAHRAIFRAVLRLYDKGQAVDPITLKEELRGSGDLERAGGDAYLSEVIAAVPTVANVEYHARIVLDNATKRRLITVGTQIVSDAYERPEDADLLLDQSEKRIFEIAERRLREGFVPINRLLYRTIELVESLSKNPDRVTGIPSDFKDLDHLTAGFQLSDLIIVAGRPGMGKTAFALNVAQNASIRKDVPVAVFSLEMSKDQLVQRILCSEALVDAQKMRTGHLSRDEWQRIVRACDRLQNAKIYIDDTPALSVLEMRAKARRLKSEIDLGLVIVDYLQLMEVGTGPARAENRQQEIAIVSRSLKSLAKELNIPVLALSQLSRAPEQRSDHRPNLADLRECVTGDTLVLLTDGTRVPVAELVGTTPSVYAMASNGRIVRALAERVWRVGRRPVYELRLASGRKLRATAQHRLYTGDGWKVLERIEPGERVAIARRIPEPMECAEWPDQRVILLAQLIGDGSYLSNQPMRYTTMSEANSFAVEAPARLEFGADVKRYAGRGRWHQLLITGNGNRWHPAGVNRWLRELGVFGQRSHEKRVPRQVFRLSNHQIALFLRHLWATDGCIHVRKEGRRGPWGHVYFSTCSAVLASDVAALLQRFEIVARIKFVAQGSYRPVYFVEISAAENQNRFLDSIWAFGPKCHAAFRLWCGLQEVRANTNVDTLPMQMFDRVKSLMVDNGISATQMARLRGKTHGGNVQFTFAPSRALLREYASILEDDQLREAATSDLFWDRAVEIVDCGHENVYDLTVPGPQSWLADGVVSHNSGSLEQDSDLVLFLYRDEIYNPNSEKGKGLTELIVGKHRNGPVGTVTLRFTKEFTRFDNFTSRSEF